MGGTAGLQNPKRLPEPRTRSVSLAFAAPTRQTAAIMSIDAATVRRVARLARIAVPEERLQPLAQELTQILDWIEQLREVDTEGVEPMTSCVATTLPMREDVVTDGGEPDAVLSNAPRSAQGFFVVPKVVE